MANLQNANTPDFDLERDLIIEEELLGMEVGGLQNYRVNVGTIVISALIFLAILAWFDFAQTTFYYVIYPAASIDNIPSWVKLWYAIFITIVIIFLVYLTLYHFKMRI